VTTNDTAIDLADLPWAGSLVSAFAWFIHAASDGLDTVDLLTELAQRCVEILPVAASGILVVDQFGGLRVIGSSSDSAQLLELFQIQNEEAPCLECCRTGQAVFVHDLSAMARRWPRFSAEVMGEGFTAVYALPLGSQHKIIGTLNLFATSTLAADVIASAATLADAATLALLRVDPTQDEIVMARHLYDAVESRNVIEQAKGMLAQRFDEDPDAAFRRIQSMAHASGVSLARVARAVVDRREAVLSDIPLD